MTGTAERPHARKRDAQRARVYAAEDAWAVRLDAARRGAARATVAGSALVLPAEVRFGTLGAAQVYADAQLHPSLAAGVPPVRLRERRGQQRAHWEEPGTVALPLPRYGEPWALRETVLLHELAHHVAFHRDGAADHATSYVARMLELVTAAMGEQAAFALRIDYAEAGVV